MDSLPLELIEDIVGYLPSREDLSSSLTVSKKFQLAAERKSGNWEKYTFIESEADTFIQTYTSHRLRYLRAITLPTSLPQLEENIDDSIPPHCRETVEDLRALDEEFTRQIKVFFNTIQAIEDRISEEDNTRKIRLTIKTPTRDIDDWNCIHPKYVSWRIHLLLPDSLPSLYSIRSLYFIQQGANETYCEEAKGTAFRLDPRILLDLSTRLPNLESLNAKLWQDQWTCSTPSLSIKHYTRPWEGPYRDSRNDFAKAIQTVILPRNLKEINLDFGHRWYSGPQHIDQRLPIPNLVTPLAYDPFSSNLRILSYRLRSLDLCVVADETLFWPSDSSEPAWPNLETLSVKFQIASPKGAWYFNGLRGEGRVNEGFEITSSAYPSLDPCGNEEDKTWDYSPWEGGFDWSADELVQFRVSPDNEVLVPFVTAFAKAAKNMPLLQQAMLWTSLSWNADGCDDDYTDFDTSLFFKSTTSPLKWGIVYVAPDVFLGIPWRLRRNGPGESYCESRQLWWNVGSWRPDSDLCHHFQQIGFQKHGEGLIEYWEDVLST